jgi:hypothetical protein
LKDRQKQKRIELTSTHKKRTQQKSNRRTEIIGETNFLYLRLDLEFLEFYFSCFNINEAYIIMAMKYIHCETPCFCMQRGYSMRWIRKFHKIQALLCWRDILNERIILRFV